MTHAQTLIELHRFRAALENLACEYPDDRDFWPAFAELANHLEANSPIDFRDYVRASLMRSLGAVGRLPASVAH